MKRKMEHDSTFEEPEFQRKLSAQIRALGFDGVMSLATSFPESSLYDLAKALGVAPVQISWKFVDEGTETGNLRLYAKELLTRMLWCVPGGWFRESEGEAYEGVFHQLASWSGEFAAPYKETARGLILDILNARDIPPGWRPSSSSDAVLVSYFDKHWPS